MVGDHNQLSPFDVVQRLKFYDDKPAAELLQGAKRQLETISDLPAEVGAALDAVTSDELLRKEVLATAARLEEPFRSIAEREAQREKGDGASEHDRQHPLGTEPHASCHRGACLKYLL